MTCHQVASRVQKCKGASSLAQHRPQGTGTPTKDQAIKAEEMKAEEKTWPVQEAAEGDGAQEVTGQPAGEPHSSRCEALFPGFSGDHTCRKVHS